MTIEDLTARCEEMYRRVEKLIEHAGEEAMSAAADESGHAKWSGYSDALFDVSSLFGTLDIPHVCTWEESPLPQVWRENIVNAKYIDVPF
jgi:hypothetical protein